VESHAAGWENERHTRNAAPHRMTTMKTRSSSRCRRLTVATLISAAVVLLHQGLIAQSPGSGDAQKARLAINFNRQIRPILSENCFTCHGPDERQRKAKLRFDTRDGMVGKLRGGGHAIVAGTPGDD